VITNYETILERSHLDVEYLAAARREFAALAQVPTLEEIHEITAQDPASRAETIIAEREERF